MSGNTRNGHSKKTVTTSFGDAGLIIHRDKNGESEPEAVKKHQRDVSDIDAKVISMYAKGISTRDITAKMDRETP